MIVERQIQHVFRKFSVGQDDRGIEERRINISEAGDALFVGWRELDIPSDRR